MDDNKYKVADFAKLIGCVEKTVYRMIKSGELMTVKEVSKGRKIDLVLADNNQIRELQKIYGKLPENESNCKENVIQEEYIDSEYTINYDKTPAFMDKVIDLQMKYNEQLKTYTDELITYKSKTLLLEDMQSREGFYVNEINQLRESESKLRQKKEHYLYILLGVSVMFIVIIAILSVLLVKAQNKPPQVITTEKVVEKVITKPVNVGKRK